MKLTASLNLLILAGLFALGTPLFAETVTGQTAVPAPAAKAAVHAKHHHQKEMKFPKIQKTLHEIKDAKHSLEKISQDLNGHKAKAIQFLDQAAEELKAAMTEAKEARQAKKEAAKAQKAQPAAASAPVTQN